MRTIILGIMITVASLCGADESYAQCDCLHYYKTAYDEFKVSTAVFEGKVVEIKKIEGSKVTSATTSTDYYDFEVKFEIEKPWKNDLPKIIIIINTGSDSADFKLEESYLVFAHARHYDPTRLRAHIGCCSRTTELSTAARYLEEFKNEGEKPTRISKCASP